MSGVVWTPLTPELRVSAEYDHGVARVRLAGELDIASARLARLLLLDAAARSRTVLLDAGWVTFVDASGSRSLVEARTAVSAGGGELVVQRVHPKVRRVLKLTGYAEPLGVAVNGAGASAAPAAGVVAILEGTIDQALRLTGADMANAQVLDTASRSLRIVAHRGFSKAFLNFFEVVDGTESACGTALTDRRPIWVSDVSRSPIFAGTPALDAMLDADARAVASVPVEAPSGNLMAILSVHRRRTAEWTTRQRRTLQRIGTVAGRELAGI